MNYYVVSGPVNIQDLNRQTLKAALITDEKIPGFKSQEDAIAFARAKGQAYAVYKVQVEGKNGKSYNNKPKLNGRIINESLQIILDNTVHYDLISAKVNDQLFDLNEINAMNPNNPAQDAAASSSQADEARQAQLRQQAEEARQAQLLLQAEEARQAQLQRQAEQERQAEQQRQTDAKLKDAQKLVQELERKAQLQKQADEARFGELHTSFEAFKRKSNEQIKAANEQSLAAQAQRKNPLRSPVNNPQSQNTSARRPTGIGELRARMAKAPNNNNAKAKAKEKEKDQHLLILRACLQEQLTKRFKDTWQVQNIKSDTYRMIKNANPKIGCEMTLDQSLATFSLLSLDQGSIEGLDKGLEAYVEAHRDWCLKTGTPAAIEFDLTVYDINQIKPILAVLDKLDQSLAKVFYVDPKTNQKRELTQDEMDTYRDKPKDKNDSVEKSPEKAKAKV